MTQEDVDISQGEERAKTLTDEQLLFELRAVELWAAQELWDVQSMRPRDDLIADLHVLRGEIMRRYEERLERP